MREEKLKISFFYYLFSIIFLSFSPRCELLTSRRREDNDPKKLEDKRRPT